jgi:hypothetical protein
VRSDTLDADLAIPRPGTRIRPALPAVGLYLVFQLLAFGVLWLMSWKATVSPGRFVGAYDANWFLSVADHWYTQPVTAGEVPHQNSLVFFPLYPAFIALLGLVGVPALPAALTVTFLAGCAAAWGLYELGCDFAGPRVGTLLAVLWSITPGAVVLHMAYSESLLVGLAAWTLVALGRRRWLLAGGLTVLAGLTRAGAGALVAAVCVAALVAVVRRRDGWRPWAGGLVAPLGLLGYLAYTAARTGRLDGWFWLQRAWHMSFDFGRFTWSQVREGLTANTSSWITVTALLVIVAVGLQLWTWVTRMPFAWQIYGTATVLIALCSSDFFQARMRFLLPAFVLTVPIALVLAKFPNRVLAILLPVIAAVSAWYGAFLLAIVHLSP